MKFFVVEYATIKPNHEDEGFVVSYRLFDYDYGLIDAEKFCKEIKEAGGLINLRVRNIDPEIFA